MTPPDLSHFARVRLGDADVEVEVDGEAAEDGDGCVDRKGENKSPIRARRDARPVVEDDDDGTDAEEEVEVDADEGDVAGEYAGL